MYAVLIYAVWVYRCRDGISLCSGHRYETLAVATDADTRQNSEHQGKSSGKRLTVSPFAISRERKKRGLVRERLFVAAITSFAWNVTLTLNR